MSLQPPNLDDRDFESLVQEARSRIPRYLPEWTDWNESDPGITLLQLHAWLTETILYRLNQLPELNYIKFLQLLGVEQKPAKPAQADLTFLLKNTVKQSEVLIEKGTVIGVSDRNLEQPLFFETDRTLVAISAQLKLLVRELPTVTPPTLDVTPANEVDGQTFTPFSEAAVNQGQAIQNAKLYLGFVSPLPFSREEIGLQFDLAQEGQALLAAVEDTACGATPEAAVPELSWQWWTGSAWKDLDLTHDATRNLTQSGQIYFRVPGQMPAVAAQAVTSLPIEAPLRLQDVRDLSSADINALRTATTPINTVTELAQLKPDRLLTILGRNPEDEQQLAIAKAILADAKRLSQKLSPLYYWLRVVFRSAPATYAKPPKIDRILTNTVQATAAQTVFDEAVGSSEGTPNQTMRLRYSPILAEPVLQLEVDEGSSPQPWQEVPDFYGSGPNDACYLLNRTTGQIHFGDGRRGRIPVAGQFNVIARQYRYGGGRIGNVGAGTITDLTTPIPEVESVTNFRPAEGGADEEPLSDTKLRAAQELKSRNRAVTLADFVALAQETPGALVARSTAYVQEGAIQVVIVPQSEAAKPVPSEASRRLVCRYLDERRLVTTQVRVSGPSYTDIDVVLDVRGRDEADLRTVKNAIADRLSAFFHPLRGGIDGSGWDFGRDVHYSEVLHELMQIPGVLFVQNLKFRKFERELNPGEVLPEDDPQDFSLPRTPSLRRVDVVIASSDPDAPPQIKPYAVTVYNCIDLPIAAGALLALRRAEISISYFRGN